MRPSLGASLTTLSIKMDGCCYLSFARNGETDSLFIYRDGKALRDCNTAVIDGAGCASTYNLGAWGGLPMQLLNVRSLGLNA
jgi:hypothetical protein